MFLANLTRTVDTLHHLLDPDMMSLWHNRTRRIIFSLDKGNQLEVVGSQQDIAYTLL